MREQAELIASLDRRIKALEQLDSLGEAVFFKHVVASNSVMVGGVAGVSAAIGNIGLAEQASSPSTPSSGWGVVYCKTDGKLYFKNDAGTETALT